jgi:arsenate reductase
MIIYHKSNCNTSIEALRLLRKSKCEFEIRKYLKDPPTEKELKELVRKLGCKPFDIVRQKESLFKEKYAGKKLSAAKWIKILSQNPILIERPIVMDNEKAVVGRPPLLVLNLLKKSK